MTTTPEQQSDRLMYKAPGVNWRSLDADNQNGEATAKEEQLQQVKRAKEDIKNMLLASLQMQHLVVLAGSGCSQEAGGPSMDDLWNAAIGEEVSDTAKSIAERIHYDLDSPESKNIEAFLSQAEAFMQVHDDTGACLRNHPATLAKTRFFRFSLCRLA